MRRRCSDQSPVLTYTSCWCAMSITSLTTDFGIKLCEPPENFKPSTNCPIDSNISCIKRQYVSAQITLSYIAHNPKDQTTSKDNVIDRGRKIPTLQNSHVGHRRFHEIMHHNIDTVQRNVAKVSNFAECLPPLCRTNSTGFNQEIKAKKTLTWNEESKLHYWGTEFQEGRENEGIVKRRAEQAATTWRRFWVRRL